MAGGIRPAQLGAGRLFHLVRDAVVAADLESGCIVLWNPAAEQLLGYSAEEAIGRPLELIVPPETRQAHHEGMALYLATGEGRFMGTQAPIEVEALSRSGDRIPVELSLSPIESADPGGRFAVAILRDVRERHERERLQLARLRHLEELDGLKDRFLAIISHELRTPIQSIVGYGNLLEDDIAGPLSEEQHGLLRKMLGGAAALEYLVDDLVELGRIEAGRFSVDLQPVDLAVLVAETLTSLAPVAETNELAIAFEPDHDVPPVAADPLRIRQVVANYLTNAIKHSPQGGRIAISIARVQQWVECSVSDSGSGIAPEELPNLFHPYFRAKAQGSRRPPGTGLGLFIVGEIVKAHGGEVGVDSEPGRGSRFWFRLPLADAC